MQTADDAVHAKDLIEEEDKQLLQNEATSTPAVAESSALSSPQSGWFLTLAAAALFGSFFLLAAIFHRSVKSRAATFRPGTDSWRDNHPEDMGAAYAAAHGEWATQGESWAASAESYRPVGSIKSNGSHEFEKTVIMISLDGVRCASSAA